MNNRARHTQYRKSSYRRKKTKALVVIVSIAVALLVALFLIIGNALHNKTENTAKKRNDKSSATDTDSSSSKLTEAKLISAHALPLLEDVSTFAERLSAIPADAEAVTVALNRPDGTLLYRSSLASTLTFLSVATDASDLPGLISRIDDRELYTSALLYVPTFAESDALLKDVYLSSWCSIAAEAIRAGVGDCLLVIRSASADDVERICELATLIRQIEPSAIVGCAIPEDVATAQNSEVLIKKLSTAFNYLTLDTTNYKDDEDVASYVEARISQMQMQLIYYKMRVLLPYSPDTKAQQSYIDVAKKYNISSWQIKP